MRVLIVTFVVLFALGEFYQWVAEFISPVPLYILGGAFLAIASNYEKGIFSFSQSKSTISLESDKTIKALEVNSSESSEEKQS